MRSYVPTLLSTAALVVALVSAFRSSPAVPPCACAVEVTRETHDRLAQQVTQIAAAIARIDDRPDSTGVTASGGEQRAPGETSPPEPAPFVRFEAPGNLAVTSTEQGGLAVRNTDPAMTGQVIVIHGERDDGTREPLTIIVPPPDR